KYEINPVWTTTTSTVSAGIRIPLGLAEVGKSYRVRVRHQNHSGRWSHWSAPIGFKAADQSAAALVHYWNFNEASQFLLASSTVGGGVLEPSANDDSEVISHASTDQGFAGINARSGDPAGAHLRVNNPLGAA